MRHVVCPELVGRDDLLALVDRRIAEVRDEGGRFLLLAGEAGVGKTRLLGAVERRAVAAGFRSVRAGAYPSDLQVPAAIVIDLARALSRTTEGADVGGRLRTRVDEETASQGDPSRRRRALVLDVADLLCEVAADGPVVVALEDLHWSDDLTLEILEAAARRITDVPLLLIGTYRSDELFPRTPMRGWRARLVARRQAEEVRVRRLSASDTALMTSLLMGGEPAARDVSDAVYERTDGIPLHVEELLGVVGDAPTRRPDAIRDAGVPETVEDAILARLSQRSPAAIALARAGAVIGRSFDLDLLSDVLDTTDTTALSGPLAELADHFLLLPAAAPGRYGFRHALICDAIYAQIPEPERRRLHARTAEAAVQHPDIGTEAFLAQHFERAGQAGQAYAAAIAAADAAAAISAHTEARELYAAALRTAARDLDVDEHGRILEAYAASAGATDDNVTAADAFAAARAAYLDTGRTLAAAAVVAPLVAVRHLLGDALEERVARLRAALAEVPAPMDGPATPDDPAAPVRARLLAALAAAYMLDRRLPEGIAYATEARAVAGAIGEEGTDADAAATLGCCFLFAGRMEEGWATLEAAVGDAEAHGQVEAAVRAYRMLGTSASMLVEYERADRALEAGIVLAEAHELWNHRHYMAAHLAHVAWATGRWTDAYDIARRALADGRGGITTRVTALHVLGFVALGRGRLDAATSALDEARDLGRRMGELQRVAPALWGLAEVALAHGDAGAAVDFATEGRAASARVDDAAYLAPFLVTGTRAYLAANDPAAARRWADEVGTVVQRRGIPGTLPAVAHAAGLVELAEGGTGRARTALQAAVAGWAAARRTWEGTWAQVDLARAHARANQRRDAQRMAADVRISAEALGAPLIAAAAAGVERQVSRGSRPDAWAPLTAREFEVARGIADGATNVEIADTLGISRKTVGAHVEHILAKLGVGRRAEIAAWTATRPVLHSRPHGNDREE